MTGTVRFADCELHMPLHELWRSGERQQVPRRVFDLIAFLISRRPAAVSHAEIAKIVWGRAEVRSTVIAQGVLLARRAIGDNLEEPAMILSVRGVGYRFAAALRSGLAEADDTSGPSDLSAVRAAVDEAFSAVGRNDHELALFLGERAIAMAERVGANMLKARAMSTASWAALHKGTIEMAARYAFTALRLAEGEEHRGEVAHARVRAAQVLYVSGDLQGALQMLEAIRIPGDVPDTHPVALSCEMMAGRICGDLRQFDPAQRWLERAIKTALRLNPDRRGLSERLELINLRIKQGDAAAEDGHHALARQAYAEVLSLSEQMSADLDEIGDPIKRMCWLGNLGIAMTGLDRMDEAWTYAEQAKQLLEAWPHKDSPWYDTHLGELRLQWADMLHKVARHAEALEQIAPAIERADAAGRHAQVLRMANLAAKVCEAQGRLDAAVRWLKMAQSAQQKQGLERMARLASTFQASHGLDEVVQELQATRIKLTDARATIQQLQEQVERLQRQAPEESTCFMPPKAFELTLRQRHAEATLRDLPCLMVVVSVEPVRYGAGWDTAETRQALMLSAAASLQLHLGPAAGQVCRWMDNLLSCTIEGVGARRAGALCETLAGQLQRSVAGPADESGAWHFTVDLVELTEPGSLDAALQALTQGRSPVGQPSGVARLEREPSRGH